MGVLFSKNGSITSLEQAQNDNVLVYENVGTLEYVKKAYVDAAKAVYTPVTNVTPIDEDNDGKADGFETGINNPLLETLPATGGIGTYLFTIGGVSIVLLAGVLFVIYMKKRETEE